MYKNYQLTISTITLPLVATDVIFPPQHSGMYGKATVCIYAFLTIEL